MPPKKAVKKATKPEAKAKAVRKRTPAVLQPETQAQAQQQTVIVNLAEAKKITRRRRKSKAKPSEPVVDAYSLARPVAVYQTSQSSQTNQLFDTIRVMNSLLEQKASMSLMVPQLTVPEQNYKRMLWGAEPIPEEPTVSRVSKAVKNVAEQAGDVAGAVEAVAEATTGAIGAGRAVGEVVETLKSPKPPAPPSPVVKRPRVGQPIGQPIAEQPIEMERPQAPARRQATRAPYSVREMRQVVNDAVEMGKISDKEAKQMKRRGTRAIDMYEMLAERGLLR